MSQTTQPPAPLAALGAVFGVLLGDPQGRVHHVNSSFCHLSGFAEADLRQRGCPWLTLPALAAGITAQQSWCNCLPEQGLELTALAWPEPAGAILLLLRAPTAAVEQATRTSLRSMVRVMLHELKTPITGISMALDFVRRHMVQTASASLGATLEEARRQLSSMNDTLETLGRLTQPQFLHCRSVEIVEVVESVLQAAAEGWGSIQWWPPSGSCTAWIDPEAVHELFGHLLRNAAEATQDQPPRQSIEVAAHCSSEQLTVQITDHGKGLSPAVLAHAFEPFFTTKHKRMGLGLSLAQRIAQAHGGQVTLDCRPQGTVVEVVLPRQPTSSALAATRGPHTRVEPIS